MNMPLCLGISMLRIRKGPTSVADGRFGYIALMLGEILKSFTEIILY